MVASIKFGSREGGNVLQQLQIKMFEPCSPMQSYEELGLKLALFNVLQNICKRMNRDASGLKNLQSFPALH